MEKIDYWQSRLDENLNAYRGKLDEMDERERIYRGDRKLKKIVSRDKKTKAEHVWNIVAEIIESEIDSSIPTPKVTALRREDELLAKVIEDMLRNEIVRIGFEKLNDFAERIVPVQGGLGWLVEWDDTLRSHGSVGELSVQPLHPKLIVPQDGIYSDVSDMDYIILRIPQTKEFIKAHFGVDVSDESEENPELRSADTQGLPDELVTQNIAYYKNPNGGIGMYSWVRRTELCDYEDYQARRLSRCKKCGEPEPIEGGICRKCGERAFEVVSDEYELIYEPIHRTFGEDILPMTVLSEQASLLGGESVGPAEPLKIPYYKPDAFPVALQKNVSVYGQLWGESDVDKIKDQQNTINRLECKVIDKLLKGGSLVTLPKDGGVSFDTTEMKPFIPKDAADASIIGVHNLEGDISQTLAYIEQVYTEARNVIGITDSFQGRVDRTATSGKAKEFSAAQAAGRLESKRIMKNAAYAKLFELMFKFKLAYADEPRAVISSDAHGEKQYREFNRYDFLFKDEDGEWWWNDKFLFSCDLTSSLGSNREAMWQETRHNFESGAFGDPTSIDTLILFWTKMEILHYPDAGETKAYLLELKQKAEAEAARQQQMQQELQMRQIQVEERNFRDSRENFHGKKSAKRIFPAQRTSAGIAGNERAAEMQQRQLDEQREKQELEVMKQARDDALALYQ